MAADGVGVVILKLIVELVKKASPEGLARITNFLSGKTLLILGPSRAGKSTLVDYLEHGELEAEAPTERTREETPTTSFAVHTG